MTNQPFFTHDRVHDAYIPTPAANGPGPEITARARHHRAARPRDRAAPWRRRVRSGPADGRHVSPAGLRADRIKSKIVRDGLRIRVVEAEFFSGGVSMARASCQLLRKTQNPEGTVWSPPNWQVPAPADIPAPTDPRLGMNGKWTIRPIIGAMGTVGPRRLWMSEVRDLVEGSAQERTIQKR